MINLFMIPLINHKNKIDNLIEIKEIKQNLIHLTLNWVLIGKINKL